MAFFFKSDSWPEFFSQLIKLILLTLTEITKTLKIFKGKLSSFRGAIILENLDIKENFMRVKKCYSYILENSLKIFKTDAFSLIPYKLIKVSGYCYFITNGLPNNTFDSISQKISKINIKQELSESSLKAIKKQSSLPMFPNLEFIKNISYIINNIEIYSGLKYSTLLHGFKDDNDEVLIFKKLVSIIDSFNIKEIYYPFYCDSRYRIYSFSSFSPTGNRLVRFLFNFSHKTSDDFSDDSYFSIIKDYDMQ